MLFNKARVSRAAGYRILASNDDRSTSHLNLRGRNHILSQAEAEAFVEVEDTSFLMGTASHKQVANYLGITVEVSESAIVTNIKEKTQTFLYSAADMKILKRENRDARIHFCRRGLYFRRIFKDILNPKFSDKVRCRRGPQKQARVYRRPDQKNRYTANKYQYKHKRKVQDLKFFVTLYCYEGLSDLYLIKGSGKKGKILTYDYVKLLKEFVALIFKEGDILLEDNATEHGTYEETTGMLPTLKRSLEIKCRANPANSPDLNPIEKAWRMVKQRLKVDYPPFQDGKTLWEAIQREWRSIEQFEGETLRGYILDLPNRYIEVIRRDGDPIVD